MKSKDTDFHALALPDVGQLVEKAKELGLDSLIMGLRDANILRQIFDIPDTQIIGPVIALGYREGEALERRRKTTEDISRIC